MRNYSHRLKSYTKEDLEGKELYLIGNWYSGKIIAEKLDIDKITDKTVMLAGGGRIPIAEIGVNKQYGRLVCPKEDVEEIIEDYRKAMIELHEDEIARHNREIEDLKTSTIEYHPSHRERRKMMEAKTNGS